jgi:hypothetical protein
MAFADDPVSGGAIILNLGGITVVRGPDTASTRMPTKFVNLLISGSSDRLVTVFPDKNPATKWSLSETAHSRPSVGKGKTSWRKHDNVFRKPS